MWEHNVPVGILSRSRWWWWWWGSIALRKHGHLHCYLHWPALLSRAFILSSCQSNVTGISAETRDSIARCVLKCFAFHMIEIPYNITWYYLIKKGDIWREIIAWNIISIPLTSLFVWSQHWGAWKACVYSLFPALPLIYHLRAVRVFPRPWPSTVAKDLPVKRQKSEMPEDIAMLSDL